MPAASTNGSIPRKFAVEGPTEREAMMTQAEVGVDEREREMELQVRWRGEPTLLFAIGPNAFCGSADELAQHWLLIT
ncbi:unnamed protein product [Heligmosomoides polygyrus]|uniref:Uncharacterized protein n=1 Tax=Heligmosomoides polygyrus TaxID=6339 RepID=A0A183GDZ6_HELPZ|nr:unnamed protein product [Heligmosomoides polygyrus]